MIMMAAMPIFGKNIQKPSFPELVNRFQGNLVCSTRDYSTSLLAHLSRRLTGEVIG